VVWQRCQTWEVDLGGATPSDAARAANLAGDKSRDQRGVEAIAAGHLRR